MPFFHPTHLCGDLSYRFVCIDVLLPVSSSFFMGIVPHVLIYF